MLKETIKIDKSKDYISIIAPSSALKDSRLQLDLGTKFLQERGFLVKYSDSMISNNEIFRVQKFASSFDERFKDFENAIADPNVKIIWAFRGGYGATEMINNIVFTADNRIKKFMNMPKEKILIGFSDITALHVVFNQLFKLPTIHGPVITSLISHQNHMFPYINRLLNGETIRYSISIIDKQIYRNPEPIEGDLIGGNLAVFCNLIGTKIHPNCQDKILILEDVNERGYQIHRYLVHLHNAGIFEGVKAVIFGDFSKSDEDADNAIIDFSLRYLGNIPCYRFRGFGHEVDNFPVILGSNVKIDQNQIEIQSPLKIV